MSSPVRGLSSRAVQAEQTRQQIVETAQRLFEERGYNSTSLQSIADELGLTKAAVYYHFRAKGDILHAVMKPGIRQLARLLDEAEALRGRRARVEHIVDGYVEFLLANRVYAVMAASDPDLDRGKRHDLLDSEAAALRERAMRLLFGDAPSGADRIAFHAVASLPDILRDLVDLSDEELREALRASVLRFLRVQGARAR
jgi:AcrR family transcriptional regulator